MNGRETDRVHKKKIYRKADCVPSNYVATSAWTTFIIYFPYSLDTWWKKNWSTFFDILHSRQAEGKDTHIQLHWNTPLTLFTIFKHPFNFDVFNVAVSQFRC